MLQQSAEGRIDSNDSLLVPNDKSDNSEETMLVVKPIQRNTWRSMADMNGNQLKTDKRVALSKIVESEGSLDLDSDSCLNSVMDRHSNAATSYVQKVDPFNPNLEAKNDKSAVTSPIPGQEMVASIGEKTSTMQLLMKGIKDP